MKYLLRKIENSAELNSDKMLNVIENVKRVLSKKYPEIRYSYHKFFIYSYKIYAIIYEMITNFHHVKYKIK